MSGEVQGDEARHTPSTCDTACRVGSADGKRSSWWHKHEVFAAVEASLSAQDAAGESSTLQRKDMVNGRYLAIALRMQENGAWDCKNTPQASALMRCVDVSTHRGNGTDSAVHRKFEDVARECRNSIMGMYTVRPSSHLLVPSRCELVSTRCRLLPEKTPRSYRYSSRRWKSGVLRLRNYRLRAPPSWGMGSWRLPTPSSNWSPLVHHLKHLLLSQLISVCCKSDSKHALSEGFSAKHIIVCHYASSSEPELYWYTGSGGWSVSSPRAARAASRFEREASMTLWHSTPFSMTASHKRLRMDCLLACSHLVDFVFQNLIGSCGGRNSTPAPLGSYS